MSIKETTFEVMVSVRSGADHYEPHLGQYISNAIEKLYHIEAKTHSQALERAKKYGRPISACKYDASRSLEKIERLKLDKIGGTYKDAIAMDEFIWKKRNNRLKNSRKDKEKALDK